MFITSKYNGYNRHGEQSAAGRFLILMQPELGSTKYPSYATECQCGKTREQHEAEALTRVPDCPEHGIVGRIRKLGELKDSNATEAYEAYKAEMDDLFTTQNHDRHVAGCPHCESYKTYYSECRTFKFKHITTYPIRAIVRYVRMRQVGHWMMGSATIGKHRLVLSGSYGSDGLPDSVPDEVYEAGVELPQDLYDAWSKGFGWNSAGSEAPAMRAWALATFPRTKSDVLRRLRARR